MRLKYRFSNLLSFNPNQIMTRSLFRLMSLLFAVGLFSAPVSAQNLLKNGKFDQKLYGWEVLRSSEVAGTAIEHSNAYLQYGLADNYAGLYFVELDATSAIQQSVSVEKGQKYALAFGYSHRPDAGDKQLLVLANGKPVYSEKIENRSEPGKFAHKNVLFAADQSGTVTVAFYVISLSGKDNEGILLTDVFMAKDGEVDLHLYYNY